MKMKSFIPILVLLLPLTGCYKNNPRPDEPFFCKINGKAFRPEADTGPIGGGGSAPIKVSFDRDKGILYLRVRNSPQIVSLLINFENKIIDKGRIILKNDSLSSKGFFIPNNGDFPNEHLVSTKGYFLIDKLKPSKVSGTFEFTCKSSRTEKVYKITEGCFNDLFNP